MWSRWHHGPPARPLHLATALMARCGIPEDASGIDLSVGGCDVHRLLRGEGNCREMGRLGAQAGCKCRPEVACSGRHRGEDLLLGGGGLRGDEGEREHGGDAEDDLMRTMEHGHRWVPFSLSELNG